MLEGSIVNYIAGKMSRYVGGLLYSFTMFPFRYLYLSGSFVQGENKLIKFVLVATYYAA